MAATLIAFEGLDGSGKSTQIQIVGDILRDNGYVVHTTREPTNGRWGKLFRRWAAGEIEASKEVVLELLLADRADHVRSLAGLPENAVILCDRYEASTLAYQVASEIPEEDVLRAMNSYTRRPADLQIYLDLPVYAAWERAVSRPEQERYERYDFLKKVYEEYAKNTDLVRVNALGTQGAVAARILDVVLPFLESRVKGT